MTFTLITQESFTSAGVAVDLQIPQGANYVRAINLTQTATTQGTGRGIEFEWYLGLTADDNAVMTSKTNSTNAMNKSLVTSGGFTYYTAPPAPGPAVVGTAITDAAPAVVTMTNTFSDGDIVRLYSTTGMLQIAGILATISSTSGSGFTLTGLDSSGFAAAATAVTARKVPQPFNVKPSFHYITKITKASSAVVTTSMIHSYVVGEALRFSIPKSFGMQEMNGLTGVITAVSDYTFTVSINSTAFSTFAFPASALSPAAQLFATVAPAGSRGVSNPVNPFYTTDFTPYMHLAAGTLSPAGSTSDVIVVQAYHMENG